MKKTSLLILLAFCLLTTQLKAQEEELNSQFIDYMESLMEEENVKVDYDELAEQFSSLSHRPLDINQASAEELSTLPFLDEMDAQNIVRHRESYGRFQTLYELKNIAGMTQEKIQQSLPFLTLQTEERAFSWKNEWRESRQLLYTHYQQSLQQKAGYQSDSLGNRKYAGGPQRYYIKYLLQTPEKISLGITCEKDAGEKYPFDFYSGHLQLNNIGKFSRICLGDYKANFGQGLVIGNSLLFGKSANITSNYTPKEGIQRYTSCNESGFLRGAGVTISHQGVHATLFASHKKGDGTLSNGHITSFKTDGLHRTESELEKRRNITESVIGTNIRYQRKSWNIGATFLYYRYSDTLLPAEKSYNRFRLRETLQHWNIGINYQYLFRRMKLFGETAMDAHKAIATLNGLSLQPASRISLLLLQRMYQPEYQANHSNAFGENSRTENESGLYIGAKLLPVKRIVLSLYADVFRFPWPKYGINYASSGQDYLVQLQYNTCRWMNMQLKYKYKEYIEQDYAKQTLRYVNHWEKRSIRCQMLWEGNQTTSAGTTHYGWVVAEDISYSGKRSRWSVNLHHAYFYASNYNNRFYIYEKDVLNCFSMPMLYGEGHRLAANLHFCLGRHTQIYLNYSSTFYTDERESIGSGNEQIEGKVSSMLKILGRWKF